MDLIERQEAIDAPEEFIKDCNPEHFVGYQKFIEFMDNVEIGSFGNWQFANGFNMGLTAAEVAIKELPSAPRWIPVSERLPEPNEEDELGFIKAYLVQDGRWMDVARWNGDRWIAWGYGTALTNVTAWMPLPKPWEGE